MGDAHSGGISKLLAAESEAQEVVNKARKAKTARLRQAQEEAAAEVAAFRLQREEQYKRLVAGQTGDLGSTSARLDEEGARTTAAMRAAVASAQADVVGLLVGMVTKVQ